LKFTTDLGGTECVILAEAARRLDITQPPLNELAKGRIGNFSLDALIDIATKAELGVRLEIDKSAA